MLFLMLNLIRFMETLNIICIVRDIERILIGCQVQNNKYNQPCPKSLRTKESTIIKHSEAFSIGESRTLDKIENLEFSVLRYPQTQLFQTPNAQMMQSFSNFLFSDQQKSIADQRNTTLIFASKQCVLSYSFEKCSY
ncbi:unnamed protein product [Paramecium octaurelia]|uniref:Uncharacterized protein n=1 Tax=Paramecium octaurelia TaxID=43137 RepID=A0A8S1TY06_PAROT|nr:unnamed protein product [Paramecium octaurelia]